METKPFYKTSEFWLSMVTRIIAALFATGVIKEGSGWGQIAGVIVLGINEAGYGHARGMAKSGVAPKDSKVAVAPLAIALFAAFALLTGCASITTSLSRVQNATQQLSAVAEPMMHDKCLSIVADCGAKGDKVCSKMTDCMSQRHTFNSIVKGIHLAIASGASLYAIGNTNGAKQRLILAVAELGRITRMVDEIKEVAK